jgi:hypothetical protein
MMWWWAQSFVIPAPHEGKVLRSRISTAAVCRIDSTGLYTVDELVGADRTTDRGEEGTP